MTVKINQEEYELIVSFKDQLNEKISEFDSVTKKLEEKEKQILDLTAFYLSEREKSLRQLNVLKEEVNKSLNIFNDFENKISTQKALIATLEGRICSLKKVLVERNSKK